MNLKCGTVVRIIGNSEKLWHYLLIGSIGVVRKEYDKKHIIKTVVVEGVSRNGSPGLYQHVSINDLVAVGKVDVL